MKNRLIGGATIGVNPLSIVVTGSNPKHGYHLHFFLNLIPATTCHWLVEINKMQNERKIEAVVGPNFCKICYLSISCHSISNEPLLVLRRVDLSHEDRLEHEAVPDGVSDAKFFLFNHPFPYTEFGRFLVQIENSLKCSWN